MKISASIDIGSNTILFLAADENFNILANKSIVTGLGRSLDETGEFASVSMEDSLAAFAEYAGLCHELKIDPTAVIVTATEASRVAKNATEFFKQVKTKFGFDVKTITGEGEAYYSTQGVLFDKTISQDEITIMDIGGASTELIHVRQQTGEILESFSMPVGVIRLNNWHQLGSREQRMNEVLDSFSPALERVSRPLIHCVAGTLTSVGNMYLRNKEFVEQQVNGLKIKTTTIQDIQSDISDLNSDQILKKFPFLGKRSQSIYSGLVLADNIFKRLNATDIYISTYGLRYGTLIAGEIKDEFIFRD